MCYYTLSADYSDSEGHTRALMIIDSKESSDARAEWFKTFGSTPFHIEPGIHIPEGFDRLLTEHSRKYILSAKVSKEDAPVVSYMNKITLKHR
jgi:hypothetical protein